MYWKKRLKFIPFMLLFLLYLIMLYPPVSGLCSEGSNEDISRLLKKISFGISIEVEGSYESTKNENEGWNDSSDLRVASVEISSELNPTEWLTGNIVLLWEEDESDGVEVDEASITAKWDTGSAYSLYLTGGRFYPSSLNRIEGFLLTDPLTLETGELQETALEVGIQNEIFSIGIGGFKGDVQEDGDSKVNSYYIYGVLTPVSNDDISLEISAGYLSNFADTDTLQDVAGHFEDNGEGSEFINGEVSKIVPAYSLSLKFSYRFFHIETEFIAALDSFETEELDTGGNTSRPEPRIFDIDFGFDLTDQLSLGLRYGHSEDLGDLIPEDQYGAALSWALRDHLTLSGEYIYNDYETETEEKVFTIQLAFEY